MLSHSVPPSPLSNQLVLAEQYAGHAQYQDALNEARMQLDVKNPARIKDFYTVLRKLAMIQPPDAQGMEKVQWCMQERTKLEGLVPECLGISVGTG